MLRPLAAALILAVAAVAATALPCRAAGYVIGEDMRRVAAEVIIMRGDASRLAGDEVLSEREKKALADRLRGAAAYLPILLRKADGERRGALIDALRTALSISDWSAAVAVLKRLEALYPFDATGLLVGGDAPEAAKLGGSLHETYCAACHEGGSPEQWLPIPDLFKMAKSLPDRDLAARFYNGIRGDNSTAIAQPMSAGDIAALIAFYQTTSPQN